MLMMECSFLDLIYFIWSFNPLSVAYIDSKNNLSAIKIHQIN